MLRQWRPVLFLSLLAALVHAQDSGADDEDGGGGGGSNSLELAHAIIASVSWVFFFPLGSILLRLIRSRKSVWIHATIQSFTVLLLIASVATGILLAQVNQNLNTYHPIIGLVLFSLVIFQWIGGVVHHLLFRKYSRRTIVSHVHIWMGRVLITLGIINGGLGMLLAADSTKGEQIAYGVIGGVIWLVFVAVSIWSTVTHTAPAVDDSHKEMLQK